MKLKRTLHVINRYFLPVMAGIEVNIDQVYGFLIKQGWDIQIHTSTNTLDQKNVLPETDRVHGLPIRRYLLRWYGFIPKIDWNRSNIISLQNFDVFPHVLICSVAFVRKMLGFPCPSMVLTPHGGYTPAWNIFNPLKGWTKRIYHHTFGLFLINHAVDAVRSISRWETKEMIRCGVRPNLITTIANGIEKEAWGDIERKASPDVVKQVKSFGTYVVQLGRIHPVKNQHTAIKALAIVPGLHFAIVGPVMDTNYFRSLKNLARNLGLSKRVHFLNTITGVDKYYVLKHALALVHPATWESYCNAVHEAMSQGCVCIVSDIPALKDLTAPQDDQRFWIDPHDDKGLAEAIEFVRSNQNKKIIRDMKERNRNETRFHSWEAVAWQVERLYTRIMDRRWRDAGVLRTSLTS